VRCLCAICCERAVSHAPQVVVCATGYIYDFPFLQRSDGGRCCDDDGGALHMSWDRHVVEPL